MKKLYCPFIIFLLLQVNIFGQNFWQQTNGPYRGYILTLAVNSQGDIFAGTNYGLFRSTDKGENWVETGLKLEIWTLRIDLNDQIYVRNGDKCSFSTNNGESWSEINNSFLSSQIYAISSSNNIYIAYVDSLFRSLDSGQSWNKLGTTDFTISSLAINSNNQIFAGGFTEEYLGVLIHRAKIFRSSDNGETWSDMNAGFVGDDKVSTLFINSSNYIFAGTQFEGLFRSTDKGENWTKINSVGAHSVVSIVGASDNIVLAATDIGVFLSTDKGETWAACKDSLPNCKAMVALGDNIFAGTIDGIFRSTDYGSTWVESDNGLTNDNILTLVPRPGNRVFAGSALGYITSSSDNGETWTRIGALQGNIESISFNTDNHIFVTTNIYGAFRSTDEGKSWTKLNFGSGNLNRLLTINSKNYIFASDGKGIFRSTNNGNDWTRLDFVSNVTEIQCLVINSQDNIFVGGTESSTYPHIGKVYRSTDNGENWTDASNGLSAAGFRFLEVGPNNNIYAAAISDIENIYCSTDNGETWNELYNAGNSYITSLAINENYQVFVSIWDYNDDMLKGRVFRSNDDGENWVEISNGLPGININSLAINSSGYIFAGTAGASIYRSINPTTSVRYHLINTPYTFSLSQNYPNPFNPTTKIEYSIPKSSLITLKVYDILGKEVATLVNEEKPAGNYSIQFIAENLSSGIYFYKLSVSAFPSQDRQAGNYFSVKKMILIK